MNTMRIQQGSSKQTPVRDRLAVLVIAASVLAELVIICIR